MIFTKESRTWCLSNIQNRSLLFCREDLRIKLFNHAVKRARHHVHAKKRVHFAIELTFQMKTLKTYQQNRLPLKSSVFVDCLPFLTIHPGL